jgi:hypothetical protein
MTKKGINMKQEVIKKAYEAAVAKNADPKVIEALKGKLSNAMDENKCNSQDKTSALKKKILLSNASDAVKAKAIKKVMSNDSFHKIWDDAIKEAKLAKSDAERIVHTADGILKIAQRGESDKEIERAFDWATQLRQQLKKVTM